MCAGQALLPEPGQPAAMQSCMRLQLPALVPAMGMQLEQLPMLPCLVLTNSRQSDKQPLPLRQVGLYLLHQSCNCIMLALRPGRLS